MSYALILFMIAESQRPRLPIPIDHYGWIAVECADGTLATFDGQPGDLITIKESYGDCRLTQGGRLIWATYGR
jgi:hypothetical protein